MDLYDFNQADTAQGVMPTPAGLPTLQQISGIWRIASNRAVCDSSAASNPILAATSGSGNVDVSALVSSGGGDCLYVRVSDAQNWIRLRVRRWTTSSSYTYYTTSYEWRQDYAIPSGTHQPLLGVHYRTKWTSYGWAPSFPYSITHGHYGYDPDYYYSDLELHTHYQSGSPYLINTERTPHTAYSSTTHYAVYLEKSVGGVVTTLGSANVDAPTALRLRCDDSTIEAFVNGSSTAVIAVTEAFNQNVATQGIGRGDSDYLGSALDNLSVDTINTTSNAPGVIAPLDGANVTCTQPFTFQWLFSDVDPGDYQTGFVLRYRKVGDATWTTVSQTTTDQFWVAPADTFEVSAEYEWSVHTLDSASDPSPDTPVLRFRAVGYGSAVLNGATTPVLAASVMVGGAKKPVERMSVVVGGATYPIG